jgi:hypothetical protein
MGDQQRVQQLFSAIQSDIPAGRHEAIVEAADEILTLHPNDIEATKCKLVALVKLGRFEEALNTLSDGAAFERAYVLYRLKRNEEAAKVLAEVVVEPNNKVPVKNLEAQIVRCCSLSVCLSEASFGLELSIGELFNCCQDLH